MTDHFRDTPIFDHGRHTTVYASPGARDTRELIFDGDDPVGAALTVVADHLYADGAYGVRRAIVTMTSEGTVRVDTDTTHDLTTGTH